ncbi:hypothetical protein [Herminiimonas aquatilis]|uniref:Uncharacterized protein n=1 Tax=Herminiimonas aquatilis TaxID=345342 RepID=A0ABW2J632_9BURK
MNIETINLIQTVSLEAIKILGPASIAAYVAYKAAAVQLNAKLLELDKGNQFKARESVFSHLKERLLHIDQQTEKLNAEIGHMIGYAAGYRAGDSSPDGQDFALLMGGLMHSVAKHAPLEITVLLNDMQMSGLTSSEEFKTLSERQKTLISFSQNPTYEEMKSHAFQLLETYNLLGGCTRLLIQKQMEKVYAPYLRANH